MEHSFDIEVAKEYGVNCAIILKNIYYWVEKNRANDKHFYDGSYWTYNSIKAFNELFPYLSEKQIRSALEKLENEGLILTGNYNKKPYDRTKWYAISEKGKCILLKGQMELTKKANGIAPEGEPIPDINTDNKKESKKEENTGVSYEEIIDPLVKDPKVKEAIIEFIKMRTMIRKPVTNNALSMILSKLVTLSGGNDEIKVKILEKSILNSYTDIFPLVEKSQKRSRKNYKKDDGIICEPSKNETLANKEF